jgi:hypothetical protein
VPRFSAPRQPLPLHDSGGKASVCGRLSPDGREYERGITIGEQDAAPRRHPSSREATPYRAASNSGASRDCSSSVSSRSRLEPRPESSVREPATTYVPKNVRLGHGLSSVGLRPSTIRSAGRTRRRATSRCRSFLRKCGAGDSAFAAPQPGRNHAIAGSGINAKADGAGDRT